jgi:hypothetical protein
LGIFPQNHLDSGHLFLNYTRPVLVQQDDYHHESLEKHILFHLHNQESCYLGNIQNDASRQK